MRKTLIDAVEGKDYIISRIETNDGEIKSFLFSLGCYSGEKIFVVSHLKSNLIVYIRGGRYSIDNQLAQIIII